MGSRDFSGRDQPKIFIPGFLEFFLSQKPKKSLKWLFCLTWYIPKNPGILFSKIPGSGFEFNPGIPLEPDVDMLYQNSWIEADQLLSDKEIYFVVFSENLWNLNNKASNSTWNIKYIFLGLSKKLYFHIPSIKGRNVHNIRLPTSINTKMQCL